MTAPTLTDTIRKAKEDASVFIKLESGRPVRLHIISPPKVFANIFFESPPYDGAPKTMNVPFGTKIPGLAVRPQWSFEVIHLPTRRHKLLACGVSLAEDILRADRSFRPKDQTNVEGAGFPRLDIVLERKGSGRKTLWSCVGRPTEYDGDRAPALDMDAQIKIASPGALARLTTAVARTQLEDWPPAPIPSVKADIIRDLAKMKDISGAALKVILRCRFDKGEVSELTNVEASLLIGLLQGA